MAVTTVRLGNETLKELDALAEQEGADRTTVLRKALELGVREIKIDRAVGRYQRGLTSAWRAAQEAGINLWEFIDVLKKREIGFMTSEDDLEQMLKEFG
jgi:predicted transcriptional regulator